MAVSDADHAVQVAYGTSKKTDKLYPGEIVLDPADAGFPESGLAGRTKFDLATVIQLFFDSDWFSTNQSVYAPVPLPKIGSLHASYMQAAKQALSRIP